MEYNTLRFATRRRAEGFNGGSTAEFLRFLSYSQRSCLEVQSQLYRALDRSLISQQEFGVLYELADKSAQKPVALSSISKHTKQEPEQRTTKNEKRLTTDE